MVGSTKAIQLNWDNAGKILRHIDEELQGVHYILWFFFQEYSKVCHLPPRQQHSAAIGYTKNYQPIGVTVHSHCVEGFEVGRGRGCSGLLKTQFFLNTLYVLSFFPPGWPSRRDVKNGIILCEEICKI